jgi:hypothetical protein
LENDRAAHGASDHKGHSYATKDPSRRISPPARSARHAKPPRQLAAALEPDPTAAMA